MGEFLYKYGAGGKFGRVLTVSASRFASVQDPSIVPELSFIAFPTTAYVQTVGINASYDNTWDASTTDTWMTILNKSQSGGPDGYIEISVPTNNTGNRTGTINLTSRFGPTFTINCSQNLNSVPDSINISPDYQSWQGSTEEGVQKSFTLTASGSWTASKTDPNNIITSYSNSGAGSMTVYVTLDNASFKTAYTAYIIYTRGTATVQLDLCISGISLGTCAAPP